MRAGVDLLGAASPVLVNLNEDTGETVNLGVLDRGQVLYLDKIGGRQQVSVHGLRVGARLDPHCSAMGKALLAYANPVEARQILGDKPLKRFTERTIVDPGRLVAQLDEVRTAGVAYEDSEVVPDVACIACPVKDQYGSAIAAISITVPAHRMAGKRVELSKAIRAAAGEITRRIAEPHEAIVPLGDPSRLNR